VPPDAELRPDVEEICVKALCLLNESIAAKGVAAEISQDEFAFVFEGEGNNEASTPVGEIFSQSEHLSLFAVTLGPETSFEIARLFKENDFALGYMLDSAASVAADQAAALLESRVATSLRDRGWNDDDGAALRYSPGYCGWHISGQKKLFEYLNPERIGLTLRDSYLMDPLKSVSGVVLAGPKEMHEFEPSFPSCSICETISCRDRVKALYAK